jgi:type VI secretion system protein ImpH
MATPGRTTDSDVSRAVLRELLESEPFRFQFFQAVRLLERITPEKEGVGQFAKPAGEVVRFGANQTTSFPASEIQSLTFSEGKPAQMTVNFMGLTGPQGLLALYYTEYIMQRMRNKDHALREFFDIFNHRAISLFYQAWKKYRTGPGYELGAEDPLTPRLMAVVGMGTAGLQGRQAVDDEALLNYAGLFAQQPRSAAALEQIVSDYFDVPAAVEQFAGTWYKLDRKSQTQLNDAGTQSEMLGMGAVVGDEIWDQQSVVRIRLGPLTLKQYLDFLPTGSAWEPLKALVKFHFNRQLDFEVHLVLRRDETPRCQLGDRTMTAPRLGWVTWAKTAELNRDPADAILKL